jgi:hypothetical protein
MNKRWLLLMVAAALRLAWAERNSVSGSDVMEYRGEKIKLSKHYTDFDEYKNDPNNIDPSENERVQRLVVRAPIERFFSNRLDLFRAAGEIAFPGYGQGSRRRNRTRRQRIAGRGHRNPASREGSLHRF